MSTHIKHQIIESNGQPLFVLVPYNEYLSLVDEDVLEVQIPLAVSKAVNMEDKSLVRAWREYKGLTQAVVAERLGISRPAYAQMEEKSANLRGTTLHRLATALEVNWDQLQEDGI